MVSTNFIRVKDPVSTPIKVITDTYTMTAADTVVHCTDVTKTVTLPDVSEAAGRFYCIAKISGTNAITVQDNGGDAGFGDVSLNATGERVMLFSDGAYWYETATHYS